MAFESDLLALLPRLRRFALSLSRDATDGDDLCQMAVERALKSRDQWQPGTRLDSWMFRIMRNLWIDEVRMRGRRDRTFAPEEAGATVGDDGDRRIEMALEVTDVGRAMDRLPPEQREAIALVLVEGFAYREAAEILDIPMGTLTSRLVRGREALMRELGEAA
ncbi:RNA polymerase sigma factor [Sphingomonas colocasiae]|uniref:RNA polymerase sigma factor n=1 Tax=Sphingomonas colocasiae TaxID=1848973 RepID=A0ABS7PHZ7_9SPHN|nr:RNA polymerase sigma factor [Sphingomonas colocasiae]MBY8820913.1 RNA polymerase sigma factor [Sphingomonas colocasiae]